MRSGYLLSQPEQEIVRGTDTKRGSVVHLCAGDKGTAGIFSPEEPYRQRVGGCVDRHRSQTEKRDVNYRGYGAGAGDVYVVPGRITDRLSDGCNRLLTQGAGVFLSPESFTEEFLRNWEEKQELSSPDPAQKIRGRRKSRKRIEKLEEPLRQVYKLLDCVPKSTEIILQEAWKKGEYIDIVTLHRRLMELELMGYVKQNTPGYFGTSAN